MTFKDKTTALIPAYNAQATITRAINSIANQVSEIIVVDDGSKDDTVKAVTLLKLPHLRIIETTINKGIGSARQWLLDECKTSYGIWLDADDEALPGRVECMGQYFTDGVGWVFGAAELVDGSSEKKIRDLLLPQFLFSDDGLAQQLARNYIPSLGWGMVDIRRAKKIAYNPILKQAEDYDHMLRALLAGGKIALSPEINYRHYAYECSVSRDIDKQNDYVAMSLHSIGVAALRNYLAKTAITPIEKFIIECFFLVRMADWQALTLMLDRHSELCQDENWQFFSGVCAYCLADFKTAKSYFENLLAHTVTAEVLNNVAMCSYSLGLPYRQFLEEAVDRMPHYLDANYNLKNVPSKLTLYPFRKKPLRDRYGVS